MKLKTHRLLIPISAASVLCALGILLFFKHEPSILAELPRDATLCKLSTTDNEPEVRWHLPDASLFISDLFTAPNIINPSTTPKLIAQSDSLAQDLCVQKVIKSPHSITYLGALDTPNGPRIFLSESVNTQPICIQEGEFLPKLNLTLSKIVPPESSHGSPSIVLHSHTLDEEFSLQLADAIQINWLVDLSCAHTAYRLTSSNSSFYFNNIEHTITAVDFTQNTLTIDSQVHPHLTTRHTISF